MVPLIRTRGASCCRGGLGQTGLKQRRISFQRWQLVLSELDWSSSTRWGTKQTSVVGRASDNERAWEVRQRCPLKNEKYVSQQYEMIQSDCLLKSSWFWSFSSGSSNTDALLLVYLIWASFVSVVLAVMSISNQWIFNKIFDGAREAQAVEWEIVGRLMKWFR